MKKLSTIMLFLVASAAGAAPFLVSDPYPSSAPQPDSFKCTMDTAAPVTIPAVDAAVGSAMLKWDLGSITLANGQHSVKCRAVSTVWGESADSVPLVFTKGVPGVPATLRIAPQ